MLSVHDCRLPFDGRCVVGYRDASCPYAISGVVNTAVEGCNWIVRMATIATQVRPAVYQDHGVVITLLDFLAADEHQRDPLQFRDRTVGLTAAAFASLLQPVAHALFTVSRNSSLPNP